MSIKFYLGHLCEKVFLEFKGMIVGVTGAVLGGKMYWENLVEKPSGKRPQFHYTNFPETFPRQKSATCLRLLSDKLATNPPRQVRVVKFATN